MDTSEHQVLAGDVLLLCSDGLHGSVTGSEIGADRGREWRDCDARRSDLWILPMSEMAVIISASQLIRIRSVERVGMYRGRPYNLR